MSKAPCLKREKRRGGGGGWGKQSLIRVILLDYCEFACTDKAGRENKTSKPTNQQTNKQANKQTGKKAFNLSSVVTLGYCNETILVCAFGCSFLVLRSR